MSDGVVEAGFQYIISRLNGELQASARNVAGPKSAGDSGSPQSAAAEDRGAREGIGLVRAARSRALPRPHSLHLQQGRPRLVAQRATPAMHNAGRPRGRLDRRCAALSLRPFRLLVGRAVRLRWWPGASGASRTCAEATAGRTSSRRIGFALVLAASCGHRGGASLQLEGDAAARAGRHAGRRRRAMPWRRPWASPAAR